jgi:C1A family cysteine protease
MDCYQQDWRCKGSYFEKVADGLVRAGKLHAESDYPYRAVNGSCKSNVPGETHGKIVSSSLIDSNAKSIGSALVNRYAVPVTVSASGAFMSYSSGIYNSCNTGQINHQVLVVGIDCETAVDAQGMCVFNSNGKLPNGVGLYLVKNSWGTGWGDKGYIWMKITGKSGAKCNGIADEAGILETGIDPVPECQPEPKANAGLVKSLLINEVK